MPPKQSLNLNHPTHKKKGADLGLVLLNVVLELVCPFVPSEFKKKKN